MTSGLIMTTGKGSEKCREIFGSEKTAKICDQTMIDYAVRQRATVTYYKVAQMLSDLKRWVRTVR
jgi:hypothetical protein